MPQKCSMSSLAYFMDTSGSCSSRVSIRRDIRGDIQVHWGTACNSYTQCKYSTNTDVYTADDVRAGRDKDDNGFTYFAEVVSVPSALSMASNVKYSKAERLCSSLAGRLDEDSDIPDMARHTTRPSVQHM